MKKPKARKQRSNQKKKRVSANTIGRSHRAMNAAKARMKNRVPDSFEEMFGY